MSINDPNAPPSARQPLARVLTNGQEIPGVFTLTVSSNNYFQADTMVATFAISAGGDQYNIGWWGDQTDVLLDIQASMDAGSSWTSLILAQVDRLTIDPIEMTVHTEGRDLTARFIDAKTRETFQNQTSSQIAQTLAGRHGMTADVTDTNTPVGRFYGADHDRMTLNQFSETTTEWDLLCFLAQNEGFDVWVKGTTLFFHPRSDPDSNPYDVIIDRSGDGPPWSNAVKIVMTRSLALAKDIVVAVRSWNSKQQKGFTVFNPNQLASGRVAKGTAEEFSFVRPNLTGDQAQKLANKLRDDLTQQERLVTFTLPPDLTLSPRNTMRLQGTQSSWDKTYYVDAVTRSMSARSFQMTVRVKNLPPESSVPSP